MTKKTKIIIGIVTVAIAIVTAVSLNGIPRNEKTTVNEEDIPVSTSAPVVIDINKSAVQDEATTLEPDLNSEQESVEEVQENVPIPTKPPIPKESPKAAGSYTNPAAPPTYMENEKVKEDPKNTDKPQTNNNQNNAGKVYVEGFGYIESSGANQGGTADSNGDIDKMVGTMD